MSALRVSDADLLALAEAIESSPRFFVREVLGQDPWAMPERIMAALAKPRARVAVKACHSSAKTHTAAGIALWWTEIGGIVITTAPTWPQVKTLLWREIAAAYERSRFRLGGKLNQVEWQVGPQQYAMGLSTNEGVRFQGFHGKVLIILDEAPGVRPEIFEAIEGIRAGGDVRVLMLGNPTFASGPFYNAFEKQRAGWTTFTIDAFATPNFAGLYPPGADPAALPDGTREAPGAAIAPLLALADEALDANSRPYLTTRRWVVEKWHEWGPDSPLWQSKVRGRFPKQAEDALLSMEWLELAGLRTLPEVEGEEWEAGLDVAGPGEAETVLGIRRGPTLVRLKAWTKPDPRGEVAAELLPLKDRLRRVKVDTAGIGFYMARHLQDLGYPVVDVNVGEGASDAEKFVNWKAELYWALRLRLQAGDIAGLTDEAAVGQLAGLRYKHDPRGRVVIESKEEARKRGVPSPDRAEALMLTYAPARPLLKLEAW